MSLLLDVIKEIFRSRTDDVPTSVSDGSCLLDLAKGKMTEGDLAGALELCGKILEREPENNDAVDLLYNIEHENTLQFVKEKLPGLNYIEWLKWFHSLLKPETYLEIGVESGQSLQYATPPTRAVGVDPALKIVHPQKTWVKLFGMKSDDFFASENILKIFEAEAIDLAFIDGLHTFDQALRDFINIEKYSKKNSFVLFHDILPIVMKTATRERSTHFWVGDTWKVMIILLRYRPDLKVFTIPAFPSGLGVVSNLDCESKIIDDDFDNICKEAMGWKIEDYFTDIYRHLNVVNDDIGSVRSKMELF